jgi:hypothetical protein
MPLALAATLEAARYAVRLEATGIPAAATTISIERTGPSGVKAGVRGAVKAQVTGTSFIVRDYEAPLGVGLTYVATGFNASGVSVETVQASFTLPSKVSDDPWLVDLAFPTNSGQVIVESLKELVHESPVGVHRVLERRTPVITSGPAYTPSADLIFVTQGEVARDRAKSILGTGSPVLLRTDPAQGVGNLYLGVKGWTEERPSRLAQHWDRRFRAQVVQVERPDPSVYVPLAPMTYDLVKARWTTYAALKAGVATYEALAYDYSPTYVAPFPPWPADDV